MNGHINVAFVLALAIVIAYQLFVGEVSPHWQKFRRQENPGMYWFIIASECVLILGWLRMVPESWSKILDAVFRY
jgi:uncharacterized membrane protein HdeD (DUF308 family)